MMWEERKITVVTDGYVVTVYLKDTYRYLKPTHKFGMALVDIYLSDFYLNLKSGVRKEIFVELRLTYVSL